MISLTDKAPGVTVATVSNRFATAEISLYGGHVLSFIPEGKKDVLFMSSKSAFEPGKPIRGGIPVCFPWFGPRYDDPKLPQHGFARTFQWKIVSFEDDDDVSTLILGLSDTEETRKIWPHPFALALAVSVGADLSLTLSVTNTGNEPLAFTDALHTYFAVENTERAKIGGLSGAEYVNRAGSSGPGPWPTGVETGEVGFSGEVDRVYRADSARTIEDRAAGLSAKLVSEGFPDTIVWNPGKERAAGIGDLGEGEWERFVCAENGAVFEHRIELAPGATSCQSMAVSIGKGR